MVDFRIRGKAGVIAELRWYINKTEVKVLPVVGLSAESVFVGGGGAILGDATRVETTRQRPRPTPAGVRSREKARERESPDEEEARREVDTLARIPHKRRDAGLPCTSYAAL